MSHCEDVETVPNETSQTSIAMLSTTASIIASAVFPTGLKISEYPQSTKWTNRRWAWEFLTRNQKFREFCARVTEEQPTAKEVRQTSLTEFGLLKFKDYREPYRSRLPKFSSAQASFWADTSKGTFGDRKKKLTYMGSGEIIFRASLRDAAQTKSRKALLRHIDTVLERQASEWAKNNDFKPSTRTQRGELLALLRILDLVAYNEKQDKKDQKKRAELYAIAYPKIARILPGQKFNSMQLLTRP